jgi:hypothetical protein
LAKMAATDARSWVATACFWYASSCWESCTFFSYSCQSTPQFTQVDS